MNCTLCSVLVILQSVTIITLASINLRRSKRTPQDGRHLPASEPDAREGR